MGTVNTLDDSLEVVRENLFPSTKGVHANQRFLNLHAFSIRDGTGSQQLEGILKLTQKFLSKHFEKNYFG